MNRDENPVWELIDHDPMLHLELNTIEGRSCSYEEIVWELMAFFARIEGMIRVRDVVVEEDCERLRL